jgi:glycosyltransferase involved in cell wall biosynthesis
VSGALRKFAELRKGRSARALAGDLARLQSQQGLRGLAHRAAFEAEKALARPTAQPAAPPPPVTRDSTHAFAVAFSELYDPDEEVLRANRDIVRRFEQRPRQVKTATWFIPYFDHVYFGGIHTIFRFMNWMKTEHGVAHRVVIYDHPDLTDKAVREPIVSVFPALGDIDIVLPPRGRAPYVDFDELPDSDIALCSIWYSAYPLLRFNRTKAKFYFVQDFEPSFYPAGTLHAMAEATYRFGFAGIVNTPGLGEVYRSYSNPTIAFSPAVDWVRPEQHSTKPAGQPTKIVIYGRPSTDRNAFELLASTCHKVKRRFGESVRIVSAGEDWDPVEFNLDGIVENLGLLNTLDDVRSLYTSSDIGVCCMFSKHPSYQPFEYLASGMAVVTNVNPATSWFLRHEENCLLSEPLPSVMADAIGRLICDPELRAKTSSAGAELVATFDWQTEFAGVWRFIVGEDSP